MRFLTKFISNNLNISKIMARLSSFKFMFLASYYKLLFFILLFFWLYIYIKNNGKTREKFPSMAVVLAKERFKACMKKSADIYHGNSNKFFSEFSGCIKTYIPIDEFTMDKIDNDVYDEKKMFLPLVEDFPQDECIWLTIGIGGWIAAEQRFHEKYPKCRIFGIEPTNVGNFADFGTVIPHAVGIEDSEIELTVLVDQATNKYEIKRTKVLSLTNILDQFIHSRLIHYLTIDIEGYEHIILQELVGNGVFAKQNITFCQIDAELHNPKYTMVNPLVKFLNQVQFTLDFLNDNSPYIPIFNVPYTPEPHQKVTFININDRRCEKAFKFSSYFF